MSTIRERAKARRDRRQMGAGQPSDPQTIMLPQHWCELVLSIPAEELGEDGQALRARVKMLVDDGKEVWYLGDPSFYARTPAFGGFRKDGDLTPFQVACSSGKAGDDIALAMCDFEDKAFEGWAEVLSYLEAEAEMPVLDGLRVQAFASQDLAEKTLVAAGVCDE